MKRGDLKCEAQSPGERRHLDGKTLSIIFSTKILGCFNHPFKALLTAYYFARTLRQAQEALR
jgi:hypothetical protein